MSMTIDGADSIFDFELSDRNKHNHFYSIMAKTRQSAIALAQKWYVEKYGNKATHLELNVSGYPIMRNY